MTIIGRVGFAFVLIAITVGSLLPASSLGSTASIPDWLRHGIGYGLLGFFATLAFHRFRWWLIIMAVIAYGVVIEVLQPILADRSQELSDVVSNSVGAVIGVSAGLITRYRSHSPHQ
jgi:VanZ family protein